MRCVCLTDSRPARFQGLSGGPLNTPWPRALGSKPMQQPLRAKECIPAPHGVADRVGCCWLL